MECCGRFYGDPHSERAFDMVTSVAWSLDDKRLASASTDETMQLWGVIPGVGVTTTG